MTLTLRETKKGTPQYAAAKAAFIRGNSPHAWLDALSRLGVPSSEMTCFLLPESAHSPAPSGLFVVFKTPQNVDFDSLQAPYGCAADGFYIPLSTQLFPEVGAAEFKQLLVWDVQVYHPSIGFVGFREKDKIDLKTLIHLPNPLETSWHYALSGIPPRPHLTEILLKPVSFDDVLTSINNAVDQKPLGDIPKDDNEISEIGKLLDDIKRGILKGGLSALDKLSSDTEGSNKGNSGDGPSLGDKLHNWMQTHLNDLEKRRSDELNRLETLFDKDPDEALKYALPLQNPYFNRGEAPPSSILGRRSTHFSTSNLGGGGRVDGWDLGDHYYSLQEKYRKAGDAAILKGDYKKAAYIYAHLLSDFQSAAQVLEKGKYYQEAAVLYRDHLKNREAAAACLERGGLYTQAIELYNDLKSYEKVGDLYQKIEQPDKAKRYYEETINAYIERSDFMEAARVEAEKLSERGRSMATLLRGWSNSNQEEKCLQTYFDKTTEKDPNALPDALQTVYNNETPKHKRLALLSILGQIVGKNKEETVRQTARDIAYEILAADAEQGNTAALHQLKKFLPDDRLINADLAVFARHFKQTKTPPSVAETFQLDTSIQWHTATSFRNQYVALGVKNAVLYLVRGNWYGNFEYHSWQTPLNDAPYCRFLLNQYASDDIIIQIDQTMHLSTKKLERNKYFDSKIEIGNTHFVTKLDRSFAAMILYDGSICTLTNDAHSIQVEEFTKIGELKSTKHYPESELLVHTPKIKDAEMFLKNNHYFSYQGFVVFGISLKDDNIKELNTDSFVLKMTIAVEFTSFCMAVITEEGCLVIQPNFEQQILRDFDFFAKDINPIDLKFITESKLVVIGTYDTHVYDVQDYTAVLSESYKNDQKEAIALLTTNDRHKFAVLTRCGAITVYDL